MGPRMLQSRQAWAQMGGYAYHMRVSGEHTNERCVVDAENGNDVSCARFATQDADSALH